MKATWVVVANPGCATIYSVPRGMARLRRCADLHDSPPSARLHAGKPCHQQARASGQQTTAARAQTDSFARQLALYLEEARGERQFDELILVAAPALLIPLRGHLSQSLRGAVIAEIARDLDGAGQELLQEQVLRVR